MKLASVTGSSPSGLHPPPSSNVLLKDTVQSDWHFMYLSPILTRTNLPTIPLLSVAIIFLRFIYCVNIRFFTGYASSNFKAYRPFGYPLHFPVQSHFVAAV